MTENTIAQRFVEAFGGRDMAALDELLADDVAFYGTLSWGQPGRDALKAFAGEFHKGNPELRVALHDEFYSADGSRGSMRVALHFDNTGPFLGKEPSGKKGVSMETFTTKIRDGKIVELVQGGNTLTLGHVEVVDLGLPFPTDTPDPQPEITYASAAGSDPDTQDGKGRGREKQGCGDGVREAQKPRAPRLPKPQVPCDPGEGHRTSAWPEPFFDRCFVVAVAASVRGPHGAPTFEGISAFLGLTLPVWWAPSTATRYATASSNDVVVCTGTRGGGVGVPSWETRASGRGLPLATRGGKG